MRHRLLFYRPNATADLVGRLFSSSAAASRFLTSDRQIQLSHYADFHSRDEALFDFDFWGNEGAPLIDDATGKLLRPGPLARLACALIIRRHGRGAPARIVHIAA